jgi:arsenate reductase
MAEGLARLFGKDQIECFSAGKLPDRVHPLAIRAMADVGIDISHQASKSLEQFLGQHFDFVITVCHRAKESCPAWPGTPEQIHWSVEDPAESTGSDAERLVVFARARDELRRRIQLFLLANRITGHGPR